MEDIVFRGANDQAVTSSLLIAEKFGKEHKHVLDAIRELIKGCAENSAEVSENKVPEITMRNKIRRLVNQYAAATNTSQKDIWHDIYNNLYYAYNISINSYKEKKSQSNLDIAEKHGFLGKMFDIVSKMVKNVNNRND